MQTAARRVVGNADNFMEDTAFSSVPLKRRGNAETLAAIDEVRRMEKDAALGKSYSNVDEMVADILG